MKDNDHLKAARSASEICFMLSQISLNLEYLDESSRAEFTQQFATLHHDLSVIAHQAALINSQIMKRYESK